MITPEYVAVMAAYNTEMNRRFYAAAGGLSEAEREADGGAFWKSIRGTLSHIYWADMMWLSRFGVCPPPEVGIGESAAWIPDFDELAVRRVELDALIADWAAGLRPEDLVGELAWFSGAAGRDMVKSRALCVTQIFNHQTHHRGQVHALLTRAGAETGATDLPFVL